MARDKYSFKKIYLLQLKKRKVAHEYKFICEIVTTGKNAKEKPFIYKLQLLFFTYIDT